LLFYHAITSIGSQIYHSFKLLIIFTFPAAILFPCQLYWTTLVKISMQALAFYVLNNTTNAHTDINAHSCAFAHTPTSGKAITNEKQTCGLTLMNARWDLCSAPFVCVCAYLCFFLSDLVLCVCRAGPLTLTHTLAVCLAEINVKYTHNKGHTMLLLPPPPFAPPAPVCVFYSFTHFKSLAQHIHLCVCIACCHFSVYLASYEKSEEN